MFKKIYILFKIARKLSQSEALKVISKIHEPPKIIVFFSNILSFSFSNTLSNKSLNDELGEKMRGVGLVFEKYCKFIPDVGEGVHLLDD